MNSSPSNRSMFSAFSTVFERDVEVPHPPSPVSPYAHDQARTSSDSAQILNLDYLLPIRSTKRTALTVSTVLDCATEKLLGSTDIVTLDDTSTGSGISSPSNERRLNCGPSMKVIDASLSPSPSNWSTSSSPSSVLERTFESPHLATSYGHTYPYPSLQNINPHYVPRVHSTEKIELNIPSVLNSALELLFSSSEEADVGVSVAAFSGSQSRSPTSQRSRNASSSVDIKSLDSLSSSSSMDPLNTSSPNSNHPNKTISFLSYADLLSSAPTSTIPLSSLTTCARAEISPPHVLSLQLEAF